jgi:hypothetical protein
MSVPRPLKFPLTATIFLFLATFLIVLALVSMLVPVGIFSLSPATSLDIRRGVLEIRHFYAFHFAPPVPEADSHDIFVARGWTAPPPSRPFTGFSFQNELVAGETFGRGNPVWPNKYWLFRLPLWPFPILPALLAILLLRRWNRQRQRARQGFEVLPVPKAS